MKAQRGSALLVVLGMLAFMVISGIAFSVFMRATRLPSSFTRRVVTTRQLAKAALAEAIDQIDRAVANDPHPNVRRNSSQSCNIWIGRVLATNVTMYVAPRVTPAEVLSSLTDVDADTEKTVPVLSLEALAYIPPPLVNDARYYGQRSSTANWRSLDFDAGRYAFIALDVSDYFDVNRLVADEPRSSNPARRVTFAYAFEDAEHTKAPSGASAWDTFMDTYRTVNDDGTFSYGSAVPLVSLADFNLALGQQSLGGMQSPFCLYLQNGDKGNGFYNAGPNTETFEKYAQMTFVTDSLDAPIPSADQKTETGEEILDLGDENNQIFTEAFLDAAQESRPLLSIGQLKTEPYNRLVQKRVPYVTMFNLSDYLDCDRIPISLGIPSVERVPMICGIKPQVGSSSVKVSVLTNPDDGGADKEISGSMAKKDPVVKVRRNVRWRLDAASLASCFMGGVIQTLVVYPFRNHERTGESGWFKLDGKVQVFLSSETMRLRTGNVGDLLHWGASGSATSGGTATLMDAAVMNLPLVAQDIPLQASVSDPVDCVQSVNLPLTTGASAIASELGGDKGDLINVTYEWTRNLVDEETGEYDNGYDGALPPANCITDASSALHALKADGTVDGDFTGLTRANVASLDKTLQLNFVVTLLVTSSEGEVLGEGSSGTKTVDMVPATIRDDYAVNAINNEMAVFYQDISGVPTPLMKFDTGVSFPCKLDLAATCDTALKLTVAGGKTASIMVDDPRYNHAPENWKVLDAFSEAGWLAATTASGRDGDIFMATSDQDYLQSVYEFAFLPRLSNLETYGSGIRGDLAGYPSAASSWANLCQEDPVDRDLMWKTYDIFGRYSDAGDDFEGLGLRNLGRGLRVNPYSDSTNVIMAAFANTPHDWRAASENEEENRGANQSVANYNTQYAWNEYSSGEKLAWEDLELVAGEFMGHVRSRAQSGNGTWEDALVDIFDRDRASDTEQYLCGVQLESPSDKIYSVDKKFLYGFWHDCFSARQQLYLVFFRSEPMMLGGGVAGVTPPQLGAKGVALVWRDPNKTKGDYGWQSDYEPHKTRILFYRQFE